MDFQKQNKKTEKCYKTWAILLHVFLICYDFITLVTPNESFLNMSKCRCALETKLLLIYFHRIVVAQLCPTICNTMDCRMQGFLVFNHLPELAQTHIHWLGNSTQPSYTVIPFSTCLQSFPTSGSFLMSQLFTSGGQSIGPSSSTSALPINIKDWFPLGLTDLIFLRSKGFPRVFSNITIQKHQFFGTQPSLWSNFHIHTWLLEKP